MNKFIYAIMTVMIGGILGAGVIADKDNQNFKTQAIEKKYDNIESVIIDKKTVNKKENNVVASMNIPVIKYKKDDDKPKDISKIFETKAIEFYDDAKKNNKNYENYVVDIDYEIMRNNRNILSIYTMYNKYDDNSTEYYNDVAYNIDLRTGNLLNLKDLFVSDYNYEKPINNEIKKMIEKDKDRNMYTEFEEIAINQKYYLKDNKLIIYFSPGEIAQNGIGNPRFEIPISLFGENFKNEYIVN
jgi:hypothetical protein